MISRNQLDDTSRAAITASPQLHSVSNDHLHLPCSHRCHQKLFYSSVLNCSKLLQHTLISVTHLRQEEQHSAISQLWSSYQLPLPCSALSPPFPSLLALSPLAPPRSLTTRRLRFRLRTIFRLMETTPWSIAPIRQRIPCRSNRSTYHPTLLSRTLQQPGDKDITTVLLANLFSVAKLLPSKPRGPWTKGSRTELLCSWKSNMAWLPSSGSRPTSATRLGMSTSTARWRRVTWLWRSRSTCPDRFLRYVTMEFRLCAKIQVNVWFD